MSIKATTTRLRELIQRENQERPKGFANNIYALREALRYLEEVIPKHAENHELFIDLLRRLEWDTNDGYAQMCSICHGIPDEIYTTLPSDIAEDYHRGHTDDCPLQKILHHPKEKAES